MNYSQYFSFFYMFNNDVSWYLGIEAGVEDARWVANCLRSADKGIKKRHKCFRQLTDVCFCSMFINLLRVNLYTH